MGTPRVRTARTGSASFSQRLAVPKAYIALAPGHEPSRETAVSILRYAREHLAPFQRVRRIEFAERPQTVSGKIRRVELRGREEALAGAADTGPGEWRDDDLPEIRS